MANNNCTKKGEVLSSPFVILRKNPLSDHCIAAAYPLTRFSSLYGGPWAARPTETLRRKAVRSPKRQDGSSCPTETPRRKSSVHQKNNQINRSIQKRHARQRAFSRSTRKAHGIPFPAAFRRSRNRQGQVCRSRPHKIPHKSQGVYLTFIPLPRDACPEPRPPCGREGVIRGSFLGNCLGN